VGRGWNVALTKTPRKGTAAVSGQFFTCLSATTPVFNPLPGFSSCSAALAMLSITSMGAARQVWLV
jgi:hypothetical protein